MFDIQKTIGDLMDLKNAIVDRELAPALHAFGETSHNAGYLLETFGGKVGSEGLEDEDKLSLKLAVDEVKQAVDNAAQIPLAANEVGKFGDGKILQIILQNLPAILDIFSRFF